MTLIAVPALASAITTVDVIANPCSSGGRGLRAAMAARDYFADRGVRVRRLLGTDQDAMIDLLRQRLSGPDRPDAVVCAGGDDLISVVLQTLSSTGVPLGILPTGPRDDLATELGIPRDDPRAAADIVLAGNTRDIDLGIVETGSGSGASGKRAWFATVVHCGADVKVVDRGTRVRRASRHTSLIGLAACAPRPFRIELSCGSVYSTPEVIDTEALLVAVGNTRTLGNAPICPNARIDDGSLDVTVIGSVNRLDAVRLFTALAARRPIAHPAVTYYRAAAVNLHSPGANAVVNGTSLATTSVAIRAVSAAQPVLVP